MMSASVEISQDLEMAEPESRDSVYSPASSYSTYSHEVKYIFNPIDDSTDEYGDYSHITPRAKQNYLSHTPRTLSASSQPSGKENRTPHTPRDDCVFDPPQQMVSSRTGSVMSSASRDRGPISPQMEEALYSSTHYGYGPRKSLASDSGPRDRGYFNPGADVPPYPYAKHSYPVWKQNNTNASNSSLSQAPHPPVLQKHSNFHQEMSRHGRPQGGGGPAFNTFHNQHPLNNVHNNHHHYQQPHVHNPSVPEAVYAHGHGQGGHIGCEPPYPMPPRYNHQQHSRRKTWSPPALKMSLLNAGAQGSRVCYSNDSLDIAQEAGLERKTQSLSEDLDVTPPKLAPISGVLAQKPGPNLIKPVAYKPVHATDARSPIGHMTRRQPGSDDQMTGPHDMVRPSGMKLGTSMLGIQGSPESQGGRSNLGAFNSMAKLPHHNPAGSQMVASSHSHMDSVQHPPPPAPHSHPASVNSSHSGSHHNSSVSSHHSLSANSYCNIPATSQHNLSANSSHLSTGEEASFSNDFPRPSDRPDSVPSLNVSRISSHVTEGILQTPSPSDSGVGELEAMLREKDAEINTLREVMDRNERAIFQVHEERRNAWLHDTQEMKDDYERKLKVQSRKSYKTEQVLSLQVYKLQQEQKTMQEEKAKIANERDVLRQQLEDSQNQISQLKLQLEAAQAGKGGAGGGEQSKVSGGEKQADGEEASKSNLSVHEELALKNKELITLKSQLHSLQVDMEKKNKDVAEKVREASAKADQIKYLKEELLRLKDPPALVEASVQTHVPSEVTAAENMKPSMLGERERTITGLQEELLEIRAQVELLKEEHEKEREQWLDEKNKVVRYQKQLQLNYVQMQRKNVTLETEVQQLTLELENRDMKLIALSGEESVC